MKTRATARKKKPTKKVVRPRFWNRIRPTTAILLFALIGTAALIFTHAESSTITGNGLQAISKVISDTTNGSINIPLSENANGRMYEGNGVQVILYRGAFSFAPWALFRNVATGEQRTIALPIPAISDDYDMTWAEDASGNLWLAGGAGPVKAWQFKLNGGNFPTSLSLVSATTFPESNTDSRANDLLVLKSGAVMMSWHQQANNGLPNGTTVSYHAVGASSWTTSPMISNYTSTSKWTTAQHPVDGSIWLFGDSDAFGQIEAFHFTETGGTLHQDWYKQDFITAPTYGIYGPEAENPDLNAVADPYRNTIDMVYEGHEYQYFGDPATNGLKGAHPTIVHVAPDGSLTFDQLNVWAERVSKIAISATSDSIWLGYFPIDGSTLTYNNLTLSRLASGVWGGPLTLATVSNNAANGGIGFLPNTPTFVINTAPIGSGVSTVFDARLTPGDSTPPTVSITNPADSTVLSGNVSVSAKASDNVAISRVDFEVDDIVRSSTTTAPYVWGWSTAGDTNNYHKLTATAYDTSGNVTSSSITVQVNNAVNTGTVSAPSNLVATAVTGTTASLAWQPSTTPSVSYRVKEIAGKKILTLATVSGTTYNLTGLAKNTSYSFYVTAVDSQGHESAASNTLKIRTTR